MSLLAAPLPGLYLALLAFLLARALRRWWDPVPVRVWAVFGLVLVILFGPALFLGRVLLPVDILPWVRTPEAMRTPPAGNTLQLDLVTQIVPWQAEVRRALKDGRWPAWNPDAGAGMPLLADPQSQVLEPLVLAGLPLPLWQAVGVTAGLKVLIALVFFFLLMRRQGLSEGAALFGGLAYGLCGFVLLWLNWPLATPAALLPLVLYALAVTDDRGAGRDFGLLVAALFSLLTAGHPETIGYVAIVGGLFAAARLRRRWRRDRQEGGRLLARWALAGGIALGLAAPALVPAVRYVPQSLRSSQVAQRNEELARQGPTVADVSAPGERQRRPGGLRKRFVALFAPNAFGNDRYQSSWGDDNTNEDATGFVGGAALLAALLAFLPAARRVREERLFLGLAVASLAVTVRVPGVAWLMAVLPGVDQSLTSHRRALLIVAFCLSYLAACTVERWHCGQGAAPRRWAIAVVTILLLGLIAWGYLGSPPPGGVKDVEALRSFWLRLQLVTVAAAGTLFFLNREKREKNKDGKDEHGQTRTGEVSKIASTGFPSPGEGGSGEGPGVRALGRGRSEAQYTSRLGLLLIVLTLELLFMHGPANPSLPRSAYYPTSPAIAFLQRHAAGSRMVGLVETLLPNAASVYGLADVRVSSPLKPELYVETVRPVSAAWTYPTEHVVVSREHPLYQLLGVRWVLAPARVRGVPSGQRLAFRDSTSQVFERTRVLPLLFLPASTESPGAVPWPDWIASNPDFAARSLVLPAPGRPGTWSAARPARSRLEILALRPARLAARALLAEDRLLASSVYQDQGWHLLLDGRPLPTLVANGPFLAAWLPAGEHRRHRVEAIYRAPGLIPGLML
ncbi:MAG TPA: YfhO family protein, partial [Thermoanaerobaculia bacterium]|nr:YfhO family protein [Thermoanaerobaculia bacterium]